MCETDPSYLNGFQMEMVTWFPALYVSITVDNRAYFVFCNHVVPFRICPPVSITSVYDSVPQKYPFTQKCLFEGLVLFGNFSYFFRVLIVSNRIPATFLVLFSLNGFFSSMNTWVTSMRDFPMVDCLRHLQREFQFLKSKIFQSSLKIDIFFLSSRSCLLNWKWPHVTSLYFKIDKKTCSSSDFWKQSTLVVVVSIIIIVLPM